jgi:hypothetical protein
LRVLFSPLPKVVEQEDRIVSDHCADLSVDLLDESEDLLAIVCELGQPLAFGTPSP